MSQSPRFSVVVPTRDRPDFLDFCLESLAAQTFSDFEVVVADNHTTTPARAVFDRWARDGWRYVTPKKPIPMHDNFEFGCDAAVGDYVAVVFDKTVLHAVALEVAARTLDDIPADIVTWRNEGFNPVDEDHALGPGVYRPSFDTVLPTTYDAQAELVRRYAMAEPRGTDPVHYVRGKIAFGAFSRGLLERICATTGRLFHPLAPDYTSMIPALVLADGCVDVGRPLLLSYNSARSNGRRQATDPAHARRFIEFSDPEIIDRLPIPGLYCGLHNVVAYDYVSSAARCPEGSTPELHRENLVRRVREDLAAMQWTDTRERDSQYAILEAAESALGLSESSSPTSAVPRPSARGRLAALLARTGPLERVAYRIAGRPSFEDYPSPVAAARAANAYYSRG